MIVFYCFETAAATIWIKLDKKVALTLLAEWPEQVHCAALIVIRTVTIWLPHASGMLGATVFPSRMACRYRKMALSLSTCFISRPVDKAY